MSAARRTPARARPQAEVREDRSTASGAGMVAIPRTLAPLPSPVVQRWYTRT
ncbi:MAG: hypothetical protein QM820_64685 [Minicystis sp.]